MQKFNSYRRALAYQAIEFERGNISKEKFLESLHVQIGDDIFEETESIIEKRNKRQ
ncbi:MAG: hypothetical protein FWF76_06760 [Oscillospiraceae bacterium]|nr:hypothetical protein [Oscillospiraceae bacterium]